MKKQSGFSLIELLIVVVIIGIVAAIAIPNLLSARRSANEGAAISNMRTYYGAQATYTSGPGSGNFAGTPNVENGFNVLVNAGLLDISLAGATATAAGVKNGYSYSAHSVSRSGANPACHLGQAGPIIVGNLSGTGSRTFVIATPGFIHTGDAGGPRTYVGDSGIGFCTIDPYYTPLNN